MAPAASARSPNFYARLIGFIYLFAMALGIFSQSYVLGKILVPGDAAATAHSIMAHEGLFRLGVVLDVITFVTDVVIGWAFYELLKSVDMSLPLLRVFLRISDAAILAAVTLSGLMTLRVLSGVAAFAYSTQISCMDLRGCILAREGSGSTSGLYSWGSGRRPSPTCCANHNSYPGCWRPGGFFLIAAGDWLACSDSLPVVR